jgi:hypothetical protein
VFLVHFHAPPKLPSSLAHDFNGTKPIFVDFPGATVRSNMFCLIFPQGALVEEPAYHLLRKNRR